MFRNKLTAMFMATLAVVLGTTSQLTLAAGPDYSGILAGVDGSAAVTAFIAAAAILALVGFARWLSKKIGKYFG